MNPSSPKSYKVKDFEMAMDEKARQKFFEQIQDLYKKKNTEEVQDPGIKNPCLVCNPHTSGTIKRRMSSGNHMSAGHLITVCEECRRAIAAFRGILE